MNAWVQSTDWAAARKLIVRNASGLMAQGRWRTVLNWIETVPYALLSQDDWLQYWQGVALSATDPEGARARLQSSFELAERGQDVRCMISGAAEIVGTYIRRNTPTFVRLTDGLPFCNDSRPALTLVMRKTSCDSNLRSFLPWAFASRAIRRCWRHESSACWKCWIQPGMPTWWLPPPLVWSFTHLPRARSTSVRECCQGWSRS